MQPYAHEQEVRRANLNVYEYDPADDGPEVEIISRFRAADLYPLLCAIRNQIDSIERAEVR